MSPFLQALTLTSAAFLLGTAMIVGAVALHSDVPGHIAVAPYAATTTDSMGVSGIGYDDQDGQRTASHF